MCKHQTGSSFPLGKDYFFLCLFFRKRFLRLWVAILCFFLFFPLGIKFNFLFPYCLNLFLGSGQPEIVNLFILILSDTHRQ